MMRSMILASVALALAACSPPATTSTSAQQTASGATATTPAATGSATGIQPGQYRTVVTIVSLSVPGVPPAQLEAMRAQPMTDEDCVTSSDINDLRAQELGRRRRRRNCSDNHMNAASGHIEGAATCTNADGDTHNMQVTGSYTSTHVEMDATMSGHTPQGEMSQRVRMVTDRIGACAAH